MALVTFALPLVLNTPANAAPTRAPSDPPLEIPDPASAAVQLGIVAPPCQTKHCQLLRAAWRQYDGVGPRPEIVAAISVHESGFAGAFGFGIVSARYGYRTFADVDVAIGDFIDLVSAPGRYGRAWSVRGDDGAFLRALVDAGYATDRDWPRKILWVADFMSAHPDYTGP